MANYSQRKDKKGISIVSLFYRFIYII
jgi:hypothetical protein